MNYSAMLQRAATLIAATGLIVGGGCAKKPLLAFNGIPSTKACSMADSIHLLCSTTEHGMLSGVGGSFSDRYYIQVDAPPGWKLVSEPLDPPGGLRPWKFRFGLGGTSADPHAHKCNGDDTNPTPAGQYAQCKLEGFTDHSVTWSYAIQGYAENGGAEVDDVLLEAGFEKK